MNILPKKRWHVRTRENIARVRRDEAEAAEQERIKQDRIKLAEKEARRALLLKRSRDISLNKAYKPEDDQETSSVPNEHVNFFQDLQKGTAEIKQHNIEHDKEKKEEREKYEKQIGYLTYLGQDTNEALGKKSWYDVAPDRSDVKGEANLKSKIREDPLKVMQKYTALVKNYQTKSNNDPLKSKVSSKSRKTDDSFLEMQNGKKRKRQRESTENNSSDEKQKNLELLRGKRLKRENEERIKAEMLLSKLNGSGKKEEQDRESVAHSYKSRYNSQFNPELARQNYK